jgi:CDP-diglyceride synthetase
MTVPEQAQQDPPNASRVALMASKVPIPAVAVMCGVGIGALLVMGILQRVAFSNWGLANLDSEVSVATWFSATLLWVAAFWWLLVAVTVRPQAPAIWVWWAILAWLALDEGSAIHEKLERWSGIDWELLYLPVMAIGALAWWGVFRRYRSDPRIAALLIGGAGVWIAVLALELVQNWGGAPVQAEIYVPTMITEEALEMIGSAVILIAGMLALQHCVRATPENDA